MFRKLLGAIILAVLIVVFIPLSISFYLSPQDRLQKADAIVVISGGDTNARVAEGVKLLKEDWAQRIIFSGAAATGEVSNALSMKRIAIQSGVSESEILIEENSTSTKENAEFVTEVIRNNDIKSIIIVTSPYHQRRAYNHFRDQLGKDFVIINHSAVDQNWSKANWWGNATARFLTYGEVLKNFYLLITE